MSDPTRAHFVCGGRWHDMDFARVEILKLLGEHPTIRTRVAEDYSNVRALEKAEFLITYTCDLAQVTESEQEALARFVSQGGRWVALHGTNSVMEGFDGGAGGVATIPLGHVGPGVPIPFEQRLHAPPGGVEDAHGHRLPW